MTNVITEFWLGVDKKNSWTLETNVGSSWAKLVNDTCTYCFSTLQGPRLMVVYMFPMGVGFT